MKQTKPKQKQKTKKIGYVKYMGRYNKFFISLFCIELY